MAVSNNKKDIRLLIKKIARKQNKNYNKMKLRLKLKFVNNKLCLGTRYGFFYKLYKFHYTNIVHIALYSCGFEHVFTGWIITAHNSLE